MRDVLPILIDYSMTTVNKDLGNLLLFAELDLVFKETIKVTKLPYCEEQISAFVDYKAILADLNTKEYEWKASDLEFIKDVDITKYDPQRHDEMDKEDRSIGLFSISRIYFDRANKRGIVYYSYTCGLYCGFESVYFLEKSNNRWKITGQCEFGIP